MWILSIKTVNVFYLSYNFLNYIIFFSLLHEYNIQNKCQLTVYFIGKVSSQQLAISKYIFGKLKVICGFLTALGGQRP